MKKLFVALLVLSSSMMFGQIAKTGGLLYSNGNPNTRGIDTLVTKNLSKNSEVCIDYTTGTIYTFNRSDSSFVKYDARPYKVYTAILTQTDTLAPVATVLENTLGDSLVWSRISTGVYYFTSSGKFIVNKTLLAQDSDQPTLLWYSTAEGSIASIYRYDANEIRLRINEISDGDPVDGIIGLPIEIRVYD